MSRKKRIDFTGVPDAFSKVEEGIHLAKIAEIDDTKPSNDGDDMLTIKFEVIKGDSKGGIVYESCVLTDKALWKLKQILQAIGMKADGKIALNLDSMIGKVCEIEVHHEEYNGKTRAKIGDYRKAKQDSDDEEYDDDEDEEEEKPAKKTTAKKPEPPAKPARKSRRKPEPEPEDDEDEDDDEDEEEAPARKPSKKAPPAAKGKPGRPAKKKPEPEPEEDEDDDDDWEDD